MGFHWSLSDSKSSQVSRTLLSILAAVNKAGIWTLSTRPLISNSSSPCINPFYNYRMENIWDKNGKNKSHTTLHTDE